MQQRFSDYATSGSFQLALSRNQVSALSMIATTGDAGSGHASTLATLWRKGLIDQPGMDTIELTAAGARTLDLLALAGLTNAMADSTTLMLAEAQAEIAMLREQNMRLSRDIQSLASRLRDQIDLISRLAKVDEDGRRPRLIFCGATDPCPDRSVAAMAAYAFGIDQAPAEAAE